MASKFTRYLRWRLAESGLVPRSTAAKLFVLFVALQTLFYGLQSVLSLVWTGARTGFDIAIVILWVLLFSFGILLAFRWIRNRLLWRLRNRLMVTYVFIGVIPVLLVVAIALIAGYVFAGQFATYLASSDLQSEVQSLSAANSALASDLAARVRRRTALDRSIEGIEIAHLGERFPDAEVAAWYRGRPVFLRADRNHNILEPTWLTRPAGEPQSLDRFDGVVLQDQAIYLRSASAILIGNDRLVVVSSVELTDARVSRLASGLGRIMVGGGTVDIADTGETGRSGIRVSMNDRSESTQSPARAGGRGGNVPRVSGGEVPPARNRFDKYVQFFFPLALVDWRSGPGVNSAAGDYIPLYVETRIATLYERLFLRAAPWANIWFVVLAFFAITFAILELIALLFGVGLTRTITRSVHNLYEATQRVNRGDFRHRIAV